MNSFRKKLNKPAASNPTPKVFENAALAFAATQTGRQNVYRTSVVNVCISFFFNSSPLPLTWFIARSQPKFDQSQQAPSFPQSTIQEPSKTTQEEKDEQQEKEEEENSKEESQETPPASPEVGRERKGTAVIRPPKPGEVRNKKLLEKVPNKRGVKQNLGHNQDFIEEAVSTSPGQKKKKQRSSYFPALPFLLYFIPN